MNLLKPAIAALFAVSMLGSGTAHAQFGGLGKAIKKEAKQTKRDAEREAVNQATVFQPHIANAMYRHRPIQRDRRQSR